jgi:hypothetical protein
MNDFYRARVPREKWLAVDLPDSYCSFDLSAANF